MYPARYVLLPCLFFLLTMLYSPIKYDVYVLSWGSIHIVYQIGIHLVTSMANDENVVMLFNYPVRKLVVMGSNMRHTEAYELTTAESEIIDGIICGMEKRRQIKTHPA